MLQKKVARFFVALSVALVPVMAQAAPVERTDQLADLISKCSSAIAKNPDLQSSYVSRGLLKVANDDASGASVDALHVLNASSGKPETKTFAALVLYLAHMRAKDPEKAKQVLNEADQRLDHNLWPYPAIKFLRGEIDALTFKKQQERLPEVLAHVVVGYDSLFKGESISAKQEFDWLERNIVDASDLYHQIGFAELKRMDPSHTFKAPEYDTYMASIQGKIKRLWIPPKGDETRRVLAVFKVHRDGRSSNVRLTESSGTAAADAAAIAAVDRASPFPPLPKGSPDEVDIQFTFDYNVWKDGQLVRKNGKSGEAPSEVRKAADVEEEGSEDSDDKSESEPEKIAGSHTSPSPTRSAGTTRSKTLPSGYSTYVNARYGFSIAYPQQLLKAQEESTNSDGRIFVSSDKQAELRSYGCHATKADGSTQSVFEEYNDALGEYSPKNNCVVTYKKLGSNWFVISGVRNNRVFYRKTLGKRGDFFTFVIEYPVSMKPTFDPVTENVAAFFVDNPNSEF